MAEIKLFQICHEGDLTIDLVRAMRRLGAEPCFDQSWHVWLTEERHAAPIVRWLRRHVAYDSRLLVACNLVCPFVVLDRAREHEAALAAENQGWSMQDRRRDLIAPDEKSGRIFAITPHGRSLLLASSGLPHGQDIGVESEGFVPGGAVAALTADRFTPGNKHPGNDLVLRLGPAALHAAGVRPGDLLVASEGGDRTVAIRCSASGCRVRHVADGPTEAHGEGHIAFAPG